ncbi:MAG: exopolyphosphatase [Flavobacterium sp.]|nr:MAG: exopolyphosphatase [Flavobacterium sp.]
MINIHKYAAIDIGSNAMRLLVSNVIEEPGKETQFSKSSLVRVPIRLGQDSFTVGAISEENMLRMIDAMKAYQLLMKVHKVEKYMACATSAMREAANSAEVISRIRNESGVDIEIIDGKKEAAIIASTDLHHLLKTEQTYLYVDVGGGSTEFSLFSNSAIVASRSFKIGTVRLLNDMVDGTVWPEIETWIKEVTFGYDHISLIGSGGNINKIFKMSGNLQEAPLSYIYLNGQYAALNAMSYEQRVYELGLNPDRADVIIPALRLYLNAMKWSGAKQIYVPKIGLSDGIVKALYYGRL